MYAHTRFVFIPALLLSLASVHAQPSADPSGHWEGAIQTPDRSVEVMVDLARKPDGGFTGTISIPEQTVKDLPFQKVSVAGRSVTLQARTDQPFTGTLAADGKSMEGHLSVSGYQVPMNLTRTGEAQISGPEKSARIRKELEGTWNGTLSVQGDQFRIVLTMANQPDGTAQAMAVDLDEGGLQVPVKVIEKDSAITLQFKALGASFTGSLNGAGTELAGTYQHGPTTVPLTLHRTAPDSQ
ncbi:MAG TPA: hypothetical protein VKX49_03075 [Bryobacteraceae bacterium]|nr:hypothetical protein [Bryobacteraceae bacterium]